MSKDPYLQKLISFHSVTSDRAGNNQALEFLSDFLQKRGFHIAAYEFNGVRSFVATTIQKSKTPKVMLGAHIDVVPGHDELFELREDDDNYYGRGVYDMKFAIACYMHVIDSIKDDLSTYDLGVMVTSDEEIGGQNGMERLVELGYKPGVCILPDGGQNWNIETLAKGMFASHIRIKGKTAHGSRPWEGDNPVYPMMSMLQEIHAQFEGQRFDTNSFNVGMIKAGETHNQVPPEVEVKLDMRYLSMDDYHSLKKMVLSLCAKYNAEFLDEVNGLPTVNDLNNPMIKPFIESVQKITGYTPSGSMSIGASDARFLGAVGVPCILTHPEGDLQHADDEWISKKGYAQFIEVIKDYINKIAKV